LRVSVGGLKLSVTSLRPHFPVTALTEQFCAQRHKRNGDPDGDEEHRVRTDAQKDGERNSDAHRECQQALPASTARKPDEESDQPSHA
jgi:hypothetical protein